MLQNKCMLSLPALMFWNTEMQIKHIHLVIRCVNASCSPSVIFYFAWLQLKMSILIVSLYS